MSQQLFKKPRVYVQFFMISQVFTANNRNEWNCKGKKHKFPPNRMKDPG